MTAAKNPPPVWRTCVPLPCKDTNTNQCSNHDPGEGMSSYRLVTFKRADHIKMYTWCSSSSTVLGAGSAPAAEAAAAMGVATGSALAFR